MDKGYFENLLGKIIATVTVSSEDPAADRSNSPLLDLLEQEAGALGGICRRQKVTAARNKENLLIRLGPDLPGGLLLSGHTDTVPCDPELWHTDPFTLAEDQMNYYGLGVIDMKGFFAHVLTAFREAYQAGDLKKPLHILATADEETTMAGAAFFADHAGIAPEAVLIGEPTSLVPVFRHKGYMAYRVEVEGKTGHSSDPEAGLNAIGIVSGIITALTDLAEDLRKNFRDSSFRVDHPTLNLGSIRGGDAPNRICAHCELVLDMRPAGEATPEVLDHLLRERVALGAGEHRDRIRVTELYPPIPPFNGSADNDLVIRTEELSGRKASAVNYSTEASYLSRLGVPAVVCGAGDIAHAHQADEKLPKKEIPEYRRILQDLIREYCLR